MHNYNFKCVYITLIVVIFCSVSVLPAGTFTVTKTTDTYPTGRTGELRWAIQQSNRTRGSNQINFNIPGTGPFTIIPQDDLDPITRPVTINGYSQPGARQNTLAIGNNAQLLVVINGNNYKAGDVSEGTGNGLTFVRGSNGSIVKGLVINTWINTGILIYGVNSITIIGNFIGTNAAGTAQAANQCGIYVGLGDSTVIGTVLPADRNVIAGSFFFFNESACIAVSQANGTSIVNNYIGTNKTGTATLNNSLAGVSCIDSNSTTIGQNIISGHTICGVSLEGASFSSIQGNYIGTDVSGTKILPNLNVGIVVSGFGTPNTATKNSISNNLISGNRIGIKLGLASSLGANKNSVQGNFIGTDCTGKKKLGNSYGIVVNDGANTIGGITRNIISGNSIGGILLYGSAGGNVIKGNYIGLDITGKTALANGYGIQLGLTGGKGAAGTNTFQNNIFCNGNSTSSI